ncbi:MAG: AMP-binding protein [Ruminococcus sp.]|nr:AMP-binding protein [Ruminococcus sp.]
MDRCARALYAAGIRKGDAVSICLPNIPQAVTALYAANKLGAAANMIHPLSAENEIVRYLQLSKSKMIIALDMNAGKISSLIKKTSVEKCVFVSVSEFMPFGLKTVFLLANHKPKLPANSISWNELLSLADKSNFPAESTGKSGDCAAILYSGGTTGKPKGIVLTNLNFNALALQSIDSCGCLEKGDKVLSVMPIFHGFGLGVCIHTILNFGGTAIILPKFSVKNFHKILFRYKPNVIAGVPAIYESFIRNSHFDGKDLSFLKCVISGGDSLSVNTKIKLDKLLREHGCKSTVREGYGLTECVTGSCLIPDNSHKRDSVGLPYADTFYKIVDSRTNEELPFGETGEIVLRGPTVMKGYLHESEETAAVLRKHTDGYIWLHTGDLGCMDNEGYVYYKQRLKRMIISSGYNIYPQNIENVINSHNDVLMCAVIGVPDEIKGQRVKAFVVLKNKSCDRQKIKHELTELLRKETAAYAMPKEIAFVDDLPKTLVGKIAYNKLAEQEV